MWTWNLKAAAGDATTLGLYMTSETFDPNSHPAAAPGDELLQRRRLAANALDGVGLNFFWRPLETLVEPVMVKSVPFPFKEDALRSGQTMLLANT